MNSQIHSRSAWLEGPSTPCPQPAKTGNTWRLILLGPPGVGKGTQADLLRQRLGACHPSTGDVFRAAAKHGECDLTPAMITATAYMRSGALVPDSTVWEMVRERSGCLRCRGGFLLDGFPRTLPQAESLERLLQEEKLSLTAVVSYELPLPEIVERLSGRRTCGQCKAVYHLIQQPSRAEGVCDRCGGRLIQREDDRPESVTIRMGAYQRSTAPLIEFYRSRQLLLPIQATGTPEEICTRTLTILNEQTPARNPSL